jgi:hypothetical protein
MTWANTTKIKLWGKLALEDAADRATADEALVEWEADDRRTFRLGDVDAELTES